MVREVRLVVHENYSKDVAVSIRPKRTRPIIPNLLLYPSPPTLEPVHPDRTVPTGAVDPVVAHSRFIGLDCFGVRMAVRILFAN